jgi:predicted flap endonuclease-1-like 5' DNA nuclease
MAKIIDIEGIGEAYAKKMASAGVSTTGALLQAAASAAGRRELADKAGVTTKQLLEWVNRADLMRIRGVGSQYSDLLEAAGVDSVVELAQRRADSLAAKLGEINAVKRLVRQVPSRQQVESWIQQAARLPRIVTH